jgi:hypothetical protein
MRRPRPRARLGASLPPLLLRLSWRAERSSTPRPGSNGCATRSGSIRTILPDGTRLRSCLDDTPRGGGGAGLLATATHLASAEWLADSRVRLEAARTSLGSHPGMILACDLICGQGLTPRDVSAVQREAEQIETTLRIALDLAHAYFVASGWPGNEQQNQ